MSELSFQNVSDFDLKNGEFGFAFGLIYGSKYSLIKV